MRRSIENSSVNHQNHPPGSQQIEKSNSEMVYNPWTHILSGSSICANKKHIKAATCLKQRSILGPKKSLRRHGFLEVHPIEKVGDICDILSPWYTTESSHGRSLRKSWESFEKSRDISTFSSFKSMTLLMLFLKSYEKCRQCWKRCCNSSNLLKVCSRTRLGTNYM